MSYVDSDKLDTMINRWQLRTHDDDKQLAIDYADAWIDIILAQHGADAHTSDTLNAMAIKKAACELGIMSLGGHLNESDKPLYMKICDECERFETTMPRKVRSINIPRGKVAE